MIAIIPGPVSWVLLAAAGALCAAVLAPRLPAVSELPSRPEPPDPLVKFDGTRVARRQEWEAERRPELKRLFEHYMYGVMPHPPERVAATVDREDPHALGGKATLREVILRFGPPETRPIHLLVVIPNDVKGPTPAFLGLSFCGNHAVLNDPHIRLCEGWMYPNQPGVVDNRATDAGRGSAVDIWNVERILDRGYAFATFYNGDVEPDRPGAPEGIRAVYRKAGLTRPEPQDWGTIAAWAWGIQRAVDYLVTVPELDPHRIAVVGHSRNGKAALVAAAFDERIALAIPLQAGCGGTSPSRGTVGESVRAINTSFPHWFDGAFKEFNDHPDRLPFDQNCLIALMAPRPVLLSNAAEDTWANPEGQFELLRAADPVYHLLGVEGLAADRMPPMNHLVPSRLGYFIRPGKHSMTRVDWDAFLDFADRHLRGVA